MKQAEFIPYDNPPQCLLGRPQDLEAEALVLGSLINSPDRFDEIFGVIDERDFLRDWHRWTWQVICDLVSRNAEIDKRSVVHGLRRYVEYDEMKGGVSLEKFVHDLCEYCVTPSNGKFYAQCMAGDAIRRRIQDGAPMLTHIANDYNLTPEQVKEKCTSLFTSWLDTMEDESTVGHSSYLSKEVADRVIADSNSGRKTNGALTGISDLDFELSGFHEGQVIVVMARTSVGKTALSLRFAEAFAKRGDRVVYFSLEMPKVDLMERMHASVGRIPYTLIRNRAVLGHYQTKLRTAQDVVDGWDWTIDDKPGVTPQYVRTKCKGFSRKKSLDLVVVDHLHLMEPTVPTGKRVEELGAITTDLHNLARDLKCPIVLLCQLNRGPEGRPDPTPSLRDIRGSGSIEENADVILGLHRPNMKKRQAIDADRAPTEDDEAEECELHILKNRNGRVGGMVILGYKASIVRYDSLAEEMETRQYPTTAQPPMAQSSTVPSQPELTDGEDPFADDYVDTTPAAEMNRWYE